MLLPLMWLRKKKLDRLLKDYPLYDPPHKVEERVLPKEKAQENFEYFMRVRKERVAFFSRWPEGNFGVKFTSDRKGALALGGWLIRYGGILFPLRQHIAAISAMTRRGPAMGRAATSCSMSALRLANSSSPIARI
jgi:hypothetical protein